MSSARDVRREFRGLGLLAPLGAVPATGGGPNSKAIGAAVLFVLGGGIALAAARRRTA